MPITQAAKKALRQSIVKQKRNYSVRVNYKRAIREVDEAVKAGKIDEAKNALPRAQKEIDMAEKKNILHKNTAARKKARLARVITKLEKK
ncbi:MAG: 30S ribosomal protein S20 [Patescibacteria group bacterium]|nr:30S ribosomal protein S20 [Patescibacteria group bacterium]